MQLMRGFLQAEIENTATLRDHSSNKSFNKKQGLNSFMQLITK